MTTADTEREDGDTFSPSVTGLDSAYIEINRTEATAPAGIFFSLKFREEVTSSKDNFDPYSDLHYTWYFGDPGWYTRHDTADLPWGRYYDVGGRPVGPIKDDTVPAGGAFLGNDKDIAYGPHACHVFAPDEERFWESGRQVGYKDFAVRCEIRTRHNANPVVTVVRDGLDGRDPPIRIHNPNFVFDGTQTFLISKEANTANPDDPAWGSLSRAYRRFNSLYDATTVAQSFGRGTARIRFLFRREERHSGESNWPGSVERRFSHLQAGAYGPGEPPVINGRFGLEADVEACFWGLDLSGGYDSADPYSVRARPSNGISGRRADFCTVWDCDVRGFDTCLGGGSNFIIGNTYITSWADFGIYMPNFIECHGQCGVWAKQKVDTVLGAKRSESKAPFIADHGPFRCNALGGPFAFNLIDYRSVGSWAGFNQPALRLGREGQIENPDDPKFVEEAVIDRFRAENGTIRSPIVYTTRKEGKYKGPALPRKYLYDKIYLVMSNTEGPAVLLATPGAVLRNGIFVIANVPTPHGVAPRSFVGGSDTETIYDEDACADYGVAIYSNSFIDLRDDANLKDAYWNDFVTRDEFKAPKFLVVENNVEHAARRSDVDKHVADLHDHKLWSVTVKGTRYLGDTVFNALYAFPDDTALTYRPGPASPAYRTASGKVAIDDFFGRIRPENASKGAVEPD